MINFIDNGTDSRILKSLGLTDLIKAVRPGLVQVQRMVQGKNRTFPRMYWVRPDQVKNTDKVIGGDLKALEDSKKPKPEKKKVNYHKASQETKDKVNEIATEKGLDEFVKHAKEMGADWDESPVRKINIMRAKMAAGHAIENGYWGKKSDPQADKKKMMLDAINSASELVNKPFDSSKSKFTFSDKEIPANTDEFEFTTNKTKSQVLFGSKEVVGFGGTITKDSNGSYKISCKDNQYDDEKSFAVTYNLEDGIKKLKEHLEDVKKTEASKPKPEPEKKVDMDSLSEEDKTYMQVFGKTKAEMQQMIIDDYAKQDAERGKTPKQKEKVFKLENGQRIKNIWKGEEELPKLDTSEVTNMEYMFEECESLKTVPQMDTSKVTNMKYMFGRCKSLKTVPQMDTSKVTNISGMFSRCESLKTVPQMNTSKVTNMKFMFNGCKSLTTVPQMDTSNVTDMTGMFWDCSNLEIIEGLDFKNMTYRNHLSKMFNGCDKLKEVNVKNIKPDILQTLQNYYPNIKFNVEELEEPKPEPAKKEPVMSLDYKSDTIRSIMDKGIPGYTRKGVQPPSPSSWSRRVNAKYIMERSIEDVKKGKNLDNDILTQRALNQLSTDKAVDDLLKKYPKGLENEIIKVLLCIGIIRESDNGIPDSAYKKIANKFGVSEKKVMDTYSSYDNRDDIQNQFWRLHEEYYNRLIDDYLPDSGMEYQGSTGL